MEFASRAVATAAAATSTFAEVYLQFAQGILGVAPATTETLGAFFLLVVITMLLP